MAKNAKAEVAQIVTDQILSLIDSTGNLPWQKPWDVAYGLPRSLSTGKAYRGLNPFILGITAQINGYSSPWWGTYDQIAARGGQVRKGEKSTIVTFWKIMHKEEMSAKTNKVEKSKWAILRYFRVFNSDQADNVKVPEIKGGNEGSPIEVCEAIVAGYVNGPTIGHGGTAAYYIPSTDHVQVPQFEAFNSAEEYYSTMFHELGHSTGHSSRLAREGVVQHDSFGSPIYTREELVAEMTAAMLAGHAGIEQSTIHNSAAYIKGWRDKISTDNRLILAAAGQAQKASDRVLGTVFENEASEPENASQAA
jgi:antirestriction protein ArdC